MAELTREWRPDWPCPVATVLAPFRRGTGDPTYRVDPQGRHWRACHTPAGPGALRIESRPGESLVVGTAWGAGAEWLLDALPALLGAEDDWHGFEPRHPVLEEARQIHRHWRIGRSGLVFDALLPAVIEQKVTGQEAFAGYRRLVRTRGEPAPGPGAGLGLFVPPDAAAVVATPSWEWIRFPVDPARSRTATAVARVAGSLQRAAALETAELDRRLRTVPGIGVWTSAETRQRALGDPDAVSFGDYHVARNIGWALTGKETDDAGLEALLEPWRGHRHRVQALIALQRLGPPRRGPRMAPRHHLPR